MIILFALNFLSFALCNADDRKFNWKDIDLPENHLDIFFSNSRHFRELCKASADCPYKSYLGNNKCWGYESWCLKENSYSTFKCPESHKGWVETKEEQLQTFYDQADFGYVKKIREEMTFYCQKEQIADSSLECSDHMLFCRGKNLIIDFRDLQKRKDPVRYHMDVLKQNEIRGKCRLNSKLLESNADMISPLQSWGPELRYFSESKQFISKESSECDLWIEKPTIITKIDASVNMYHHFCDFFNLYAAQHVHNTDDGFAFMKDVQVLIWETFPYGSNFEIAWKAFTKNQIWNLNQVSGKRVCFREVIFPLLPRMIFGLYYNTPLIWGCENSGLFHAFSHHITHRLGVKDRRVTSHKLHVTILSRQSKYRRILNENDLIQSLDPELFEIKKVQFTHSEPFIDQLRQDKWTDILVGIHGSGLTHLLFLPDWAVIVELYNCGDEHCYKDLARLRGVKYSTWENVSTIHPQDEGHHPTLGAHEKFTNYRFDEKDFIKLIHEAAKSVKNHKEWKLRRFKAREEL